MSSQVYIIQKIGNYSANTHYHAHIKMPASVLNTGAEIVNTIQFNIAK